MKDLKTVFSSLIFAFTLILFFSTCSVASQSVPSFIKVNHKYLFIANAVVTGTVVKIDKGSWIKVKTDKASIAEYVWVNIKTQNTIIEVKN